MKTFFATFAAILCAAAVIFGIYQYNQSQEKRRDTVRRVFKLASETSEFYATYAVSNKLADPVIHDGMPQSITTLAAMAERQTIPVSEMRRPAADVVDNYTLYVDYVERAHGEQKKWVSDMRAGLARLQASVK